MYEKFNREEERYATVVKLSDARKAEREKLISEYQKRSANAFAPQTLRNYLLCCANPVRDSSRESSMIAGVHEQTHIPDLQDQELASL